LLRKLAALINGFYMRPASKDLVAWNNALAGRGKQGVIPKWRSDILNMAIFRYIIRNFYDKVPMGSHRRFKIVV
jgi:hypothetical protein